jgi:integrase
MALRKVCTKCRKTEARCKCVTPSWRYQIDYYDPTGKRVRRDYEKKKDAVAELGKRVSLIAEGSYLDVKKEYKTTLKELLAKYKENYQHQASYKSWKRYCVKNFKEHFGEDTLLANVGYADLETYRNHLRRKPTNRGDTIRTDASVNREMSCLRHIFKKAVEWAMVEISPFDKGGSLLLKENNERIRYLTEDEIERLLAECPKHLSRIVECALNTGMRRGEMLSLKWSQIRDGFIYLQKTKTNRARQIPINEDLAKVLSESRSENQLKSEYVFPFRKGEHALKGEKTVRKRKGLAPAPEAIGSIKTSFNSAVRRAGIEDFRFHDLRHTFASHMVMRGATIKEVQEILGHKNISMTMRYAHLSQEHKEKAVNLLNGLTASKKPANGHEMVTKLKPAKSPTG